MFLNKEVKLKWVEIPFTKFSFFIKMIDSQLYFMLWHNEKRCIKSGRFLFIKYKIKYASIPKS